MNTEKAQNRLHDLNLKSLDFARFEISTERVDYPLADSVENATYEIYCLLWFNFISEIFESAEIDSPNDIFNVSEVVIQHRKWWKADPENQSYKDDFRTFIEGELSKQNVKRDNVEARSDSELITATGSHFGFNKFDKDLNAGGKNDS